MQRMFNRISYARGDEIDSILRRKLMESEVSSKGLRRVILRYNQLITQSKGHDPKILIKLLDCISGHTNKVLNKLEYPQRDILLNIINKSILNSNDIEFLINYILNLSYPEYAKLIESLENLHNR